MRSSTRRHDRSADLIVLGSSPRWRRQSRFFSPTVDHVLRHAPCQVLVVAFPEGVFEDDADRRDGTLSHEGVVIGCGRVGSAVALQLAGGRLGRHCVDEEESALDRLGGWRGGFIVGHGDGQRRARRAGVARPTRRSYPRTATTRTSSSGRCYRGDTGSGASSCACSTRCGRTSTRSAACARCVPRRRRSRCSPTRSAPATRPRSEAPWLSGCTRSSPEAARSERTSRARSSTWATR